MKSKEMINTQFSALEGWREIMEGKEEPSDELVMIAKAGWVVSFLKLYVYVLLYVWHFLIKFKLKKWEKVLV